ncbi:nuclear transport factor 2 family protein [Actinocorallia sp. API 0066]|uniref:nuclear transport factor 2 family protein n=1 Tax=Actinocorallia sp. API 0066 TaxID=2896846 RepID=UPI001E554996|nr:nuclear transport factor 2 family protein [Actinocorallia sp. API 0066]MCD0449350.1 nuclear transport factor 2 family protein [Actinocorallia sp. API 0066]
MTRPNGHLPPSAAATAAGVDHVLLSYRYLDEGDTDAYASLFTENPQIHHPASPRACHHHVYKVVAQADSVAVMGRLTRLPPSPPIDFADFFTLSPTGLLHGYRRFYHTPPP